MAQFLHQITDLLPIGSLWVEGELSIIKDDEDSFRGEGVSRWSQVFEVSGARTDNFRESVEEIRPRGRKLTQRMNRRLSPNRSLTRLRWGIAKATEVFPMPSTPRRAIEVRLSMRPTIHPISSSRPKQALRGGRGVSPRGGLRKHKVVDTTVSETIDLV